MKKVVIFTTFLFIMVGVLAQNSLQIDIPVDILKKDVYDFAKIKVIYNYTHVKDAKSVVKEKEYGYTALLIGDDFVGFSDWIAFKQDSLNDAYSIQGKNAGELVKKYMELEKIEKEVYTTPLIINRQTGECTIRMKVIFGNTYEYNQPLPTIDWQLEAEKKKIKGINCNKATCRFGGRDWEAWYSVEHPISFGPYLFNGLPGLIIELKDSKNHHHFKLNGIENPKNGTPIYLLKRKSLIRTTREKARQGAENERKDPVKAMLAKQPDLAKQNGGILLQMKRSEPYNPIELE